MLYCMNCVHILCIQYDKMVPTQWYGNPVWYVNTQLVLVHNETLWARGGQLDGLQVPYFRRTLTQEPIICVPDLLVILLNHRECKGNGDNREDMTILS